MKMEVGIFYLQIHKQKLTVYVEIFQFIIILKRTKVHLFAHG